MIIMPVSVSSSIVIGVKKNLEEDEEDDFPDLGALRKKITEYLESVGLSSSYAEWFDLMYEDDMYKKYTSEYYHVEHTETYIDSGDPDLTKTDPGDDELLQFFLKKLPKKFGDSFSCLVTPEDRKLFSHLTGGNQF